MEPLCLGARRGFTIGRGLRRPVSGFGGLKIEECRWNESSFLTLGVSIHN